MGIKALAPPVRRAMTKLWPIAAAIGALQLLTLAVELAALGSMRPLGHMLACVYEQYGQAAGLGVTEHIVRHRSALAMFVGAVTHGVPLVVAIRHRERPRRLARVVRLQVVLSLGACAVMLTGWLLLVSDLVRVYHQTNCFCSPW